MKTKRKPMCEVCEVRYSKDCYFGRCYNCYHKGKHKIMAYSLQEIISKTENKIYTVKKSGNSGMIRLNPALVGAKVRVRIEK